LNNHWTAFGSLFFLLHQDRLLWLLNAPIIGRWFRWVLRISGESSSVGSLKIDRILPNAIFWWHGDKQVAEFRTHAKFSKRLYYAFRPLWWTLHAWDWAVGDRELFPELNAAIRNLLIPKPFAPHPVSKIVITVATGAEIKPIRYVGEIFAGFVSKMNVVGISTLFAKFRWPFSAFYSFMKGLVSNLIALPINVLFRKGPDVFLSSDPRFKANTIFVPNHPLRSLFSEFKTWFVRISSPYKIAFMRTVFPFRFVWINGKLFAANCANKFYISALHIFSIRLSFSLSTLTAYPDAGTGGTTVDGFTGHVVLGGASWATLTGGVGTESGSTSNPDNAFYIQAHATANWVSLQRAIFTLGISGLPVDATSATFTLTGTEKGDGASWSPNLGLYGASPAANNNLVAGDFDSVGSTPFTDSLIAYSGFNAAGENTFTLNAAGVAAINAARVGSGIVGFGTRNQNYDVANSAPSFSAGAYSYMYINFADQTGTANDPKLVVTYTIPESYITITKNWALE
jgi:hypothetical protein